MILMVNTGEYQSHGCVTGKESCKGSSSPRFPGDFILWFLKHSFEPKELWFLFGEFSPPMELGPKRPICKVETCNVGYKWSEMGPR